MLPIQRGDSAARVLHRLVGDRSPLTRFLSICVVGETRADAILCAVAGAAGVDHDQDVRQASAWTLERCRGKEVPMLPIIRHVQILRRVAVFSGLGIRELRAVASIAEPTASSAGTVLVRSGALFEGVHLVTVGRVEARSPSGDGQIAPEIIEPGDVLGLLGLFAEQPARRDYVALDNVETLLIRAGHFMELMKLYPLIGVNACRYLAGQLQKR